MHIPEAMTNQRTLPHETSEFTAGPEVQENAKRESLVPCLIPAAPEPMTLSPVVARLPVEVDVAVPVPEFRVRNLVELQVGQVIETQWEHTDDLPLATGNVQFAWSEFEIVDSRLGIRITRLA
jgi:flagellar motor switch/type III secretory pathway protein FliN